MLINVTFTPVNVFVLMFVGIDILVNSILERDRMTFTANGRDDHVTMFSLYLPLAVFRYIFLIKLSSFALASKDRFILHSPHLCTHF